MGFSGLIIFFHFFLFVYSAIQFYDQFQFVTIKISNIIRDGMLSPEFQFPLIDMY